MDEVTATDSAHGRHRDASAIRSYDDRDEAAVVALMEVVFANDSPWNVPLEVVRRKTLVQRELFLVAEVDGVVVGTLMAGFDGVRGWVHKLAVHPDHRRCGLASGLMAEAERRLRALGCPKLNLQVRASNADVVAFYRRLGYAVEANVSLGKRLET